MRWYFSLVVLLFGIVTIDMNSLKWSLLSIILFSIPMLLQFTNSKSLHIWALWGGFFLVFQSLLSPALIDRDFKTMIPSMYKVVDVKAGIPGISGKQTITTDSKGFRVTKNIDYGNDSSFRIFAIGGSTTMQVYLDDLKTWTHLSQENLSKKTSIDIEVINTGVSGLRAKHHLATLRNIIGLHPDLVVFLVGLNDWNWHIKNAFQKDTGRLKINHYRNNYFLKKSLIGNFILIVSNSMSINKKSNKPLLREDHGQYFTKQRGSLSRPNIVSFTPEGVHKDYIKYLSDISDICSKNKIKCMFITQPTGYQSNATENFKKGFWMTPPNELYTLKFKNMVAISSLYNSFLMKFAVDNGHYTCDAALKLRPTVDNFSDDCHFNTSGAQNMSNIISECMENIVKNN